MPDSHFESKDQEARLFHEGIELFNSGRWFDAHEVWEDIWHIATGARKRFYQGLIQCAVTLEHVRRGNPRGVRSVWETCLTKFEGLDGCYMGVEVTTLLSDLQHVLNPILDLPKEIFDPDRPRGQKLPINWDQVPKISLRYNPFD